MKPYLEKLPVNGVEVEIAFEFLHKDEPVQIDTINGISSLNFIEPYLDECEVVISDFLINEALAKKESLAESHSDESRGN